MRHQGVEAMFTRVADLYPHSIAISSPRGQLSYSDLDSASNRLANFITASLIQRGSVIAIASSSQVEMITSILAVLKAGCAFAPLDLDLPPLRLQSMLELITPSAIICQQELEASLQQVSGQLSRKPRLILIGEEEGSSSRRPEVGRGGEELSYIYFTSGSTGRPKAIAGRYKGIDHFIGWEIKQLGVEAGARVSQMLAATFDGSLRDIFLPLCVGGVACVPPSKEVTTDGGELMRWVDEEGINIVHCVPTMFRAMVNEEMREGRMKELRYIVMAGEAIAPADVGKWMGVYGERVKLVNLYGTSETTMAKFYYEIKGSDVGRRSIPIGKPIEGATAVVVNEKGKVSPIGMIGEVYIRTEYRSLGYYGDEEKTREVFIKNPLSEDADDIVYKTGDIGRILKDGNFEYLGRKDGQVKIRGKRVELGEVEAVIKEHAAVLDVAVIEREDETGDRYLCGYVVMREEGASRQVREYASQRLEAHMVPEKIVEMRKLPRTISGKIDRKGLPEVGRGAGEEEYVGPRTRIEEEIARIWREVLGLEKVSVIENFFRIGGHSLRAAQVMGRIRGGLRVEVGLKELFEKPTVEGLAEEVERRMREGEKRMEEEEIRRVERTGELPLSFAQQRLWFLDQLVPGNPYFNLATAVRLKGVLETAALMKSFDQIIERQESLRTVFISNNGSPAQKILPAITFRIPIIDLGEMEDLEQEAELSRLAREHARMPFNLSEGPLLRIAIVRLGEQEQALLLIMHHIISDGWSLDVFVREAVALYTSYVTGEAARLPGLPVQYADYACWERDWLQGDALGESLDYWKSQLANLPASLNLPTDKPRVLSGVIKRAQEPVVIDTSMTRGLVQLSRKEGATLFMILLAAYQFLLHNYSGQDDIVVGTPVANRSRAELENLIGLFINTLALFTKFSGDPTFAELLSQVQEMTLGAYIHQDLPFDTLVNELQPDRARNRLPLFQVWFVLQNTPAARVDLPSLSLSSVKIDHETGQFDLSLNLTEAAGRIIGYFEYDSGLFEQATIKRMSRAFIKILQIVVAQPQTRLSEIKTMLDIADKNYRKIEREEFKELRRKKRDEIRLKRFNISATEEQTGV